MLTKQGKLSKTCQNQNLLTSTVSLIFVLSDAAISLTWALKMENTFCWNTLHQTHFCERKPIWSLLQPAYQSSGWIFLLVVNLANLKIAKFSQQSNTFLTCCSSSETISSPSSITRSVIFNASSQYRSWNKRRYYNRSNTVTVDNLPKVLKTISLPYRFVLRQIQFQNFLIPPQNSAILTNANTTGALLATTPLRAWKTKLKRDSIKKPTR